MEAIDKNLPSLPPNYVSLADLQRRWMKQQQENKREKEIQIQIQIQIEKEKEKEKEKDIIQLVEDDGKQKQENRRGESQQPNLPPNYQIRGEDFKGKPQFRKPDSSISSSNPNFHKRRPYHRNYHQGIGSKECRLVKSSPEPKPSESEGAAKITAEIDGGDETVSIQIDAEQTKKIEKKKKKKRTKKRNPVTEERKTASKEEYPQRSDNEGKGGGEAPSKPAMCDRKVEIEGGEAPLKPAWGDRTVKIRGSKAPLNPAVGHWTVKIESGKSQMKPAIGDRTVEIDGVKDPMKPSLDDRTVNLEEEIKKKLSIKGRGWRNDRRSRAVIEGSKWTHGAYGRTEHREMVKPRGENGWVWMKKKGEVSEHTMVE